MTKRAKKTVFGILSLVVGLAMMLIYDYTLLNLLGSAFIGVGIGLLSVWLKIPKKRSNE